MQIIQNTTEFQIQGRSAVAIGKFDGIHRGHIELLRHILKQKEKGLHAVVFTFDPPASVFFGRAGEKELSPIEEKRRFFLELGIDILVEFPLNEESAAISPEDFVEKILAGQMQAAYIAAGEDLSFGYGGRGNRELLQKLSGRFDYQAEIIPKVLDGSREISSSYVREEVEKGNMEKAAWLLGRNYGITGRVETGKKLGRRLGMPTVNLYPGENKLLPPNGVYYSKMISEEGSYDGITNIGRKPTVNDTQTVSVETYLYNFMGNMYGKEVVVELMHFKRPEQKFGDVEELRRQMEADVADGKKFHNSIV